LAIASSKKSAGAKRARGSSSKRDRADQPTARFEQEGRLEWAILAPLDGRGLETHVARLKKKLAHRCLVLDPDDERRSWCVVPGTKRFSAVIETSPGSTRSEVDL